MCVHLASCPVCGVLEDGGEVEAAEVSALRARGGAYGAGAAALSAIASVVCVEECTDRCARTVVHGQWCTEKPPAAVRRRHMGQQQAVPRS